MHACEPQSVEKLVIDTMLINSAQPFLVYEALQRSNTWKSSASTLPDPSFIHPHPVIVESLKQLNRIFHVNHPDVNQKIYNIMFQIRQIEGCQEQLGLEVGEDFFFPCPNNKQECVKRKKMLYLGQFAEFAFE